MSTLRTPLLFNMLSAIVFTHLATMTLAANEQNSSSQRKNNSLMDMDIEKLMSLEVTTASRYSQKLSEVASAVFVITQDDIRRSGVTSIPEALRMVPGVEVARVSTDKWAISIRGFNGRFADKLQVLMDGRSVYNPLFAGVQWEQQDTLLEDIERIEVIRGPNASVWGANAVNGIINIITKKATQTQGLLLTAGGGSFERGFFGARYGGVINDNTHYRFYTKGFTRDQMSSVSNASANNAWHSARGGFRLDHSRGIDQLTVQGDIFYNSIGDTFDKTSLAPPIIQSTAERGHNEGGNIRLRWDRTLSEKSSIMFQTYYDRVDYKVMASSQFRTESFDIDFQHRFPFLDRHNLTWGANYRLYHNKIYDTQVISFSPRQQTNHLASVFILDEMTLIPEYLRFTLGTRIDHNDFTGFEIQPNARLMWTPNPENSVWASVSRAVRTPSRAENDVALSTRIINSIPETNTITPFPVLVQLTGNSKFNSEKMIAYELGYRHQISHTASIDIAGFFNDYSQLRDLAPPLSKDISVHSSFPIHFIYPIGLTNNASGYTYGAEVSADWKPTQRWRLQGNYSYLHMHINSNPAFKSIDPTTGGADKVSPSHQVSFRSHYDLTERMQFNLWLRYVSSVDFYKIPSYVTMDTKIAYKPVRNLEVFLVGQNLFSRNHREFVSDFIPSLPMYIARGIYVGGEWRF